MNIHNVRRFHALHSIASLAFLSLVFLLSLHGGQAAENLIKDGGFEQYLAQPDEQGNPFKVWSGWKWEGNCRRVADTEIKHGGQASAEMLSYGRCKLGLSQTFRTEAGWYKLSLVSDSMVELMDGVLTGCGAQSPVRFLTADGRHVAGLEYRAIQTSEGWLAFVNNLDRKRDRQVTLATSLKVTGIRSLTLETDLAPSFTVPAGETYILRLTHPSQ